MESQDISSLLAFAEGLFVFYRLFLKKEGFFKTFVVLVLGYRKIEKD